MKATQQLHNDKTGFVNLFLILSLLAAVLLFLPKTAHAAEQQTVFKDDIYRYIITDEDKKEVTLIGFEATDSRKDLTIPGTVSINQQVYTVRLVDIRWEYYENDTYKDFYNSVTKLTFADTFQGTLNNPLFAFQNVRTMEFMGTTAPQSVKVSISNRSQNPDVVFLVPVGTESAYSKVITESLSYYNGSDLYEMDIPMTPTVISKGTTKIENGVFSKDGLLYQVTSTAKTGTGKVQLIGITSEKKHSYLNLPKELTNNGYTYELTKLCKFSLVHIGAAVIIVPDTVTEMESSVFDKQVELLFLSKNCKVIPTNMITDENDDSSLRYVYVPEGVTTITDKAFSDIMKNEGSIILPTSIQTLGKQSLYSFKLVTFLNKQPIAKLTSAIKSGTTVKVNSSAISAYQKALSSKISVVAAKNVVKSTKLSVNYSSLSLNTAQTSTLKGTLTKGSNETVFWLSTDTGIFEVSSKGIVNPKKAGVAYAIAYTRTSGLYKAVKVTVTDKLITDGIYTYRVTDATRKTVSLYQIKPTASTKKLSIPETITYNGKTYQVTGAIADPQDTGKPLIDIKYKNNKIESISFPKTLTGVIGYLGELKSIKSITFQGKTAPASIQNWYDDGGLLAFQAIIYVPKGSVAAYTSALWLSADENTYSYIHYGCRMDYNVVETGSDQLQRFVKDGILYVVTKKAGTNSGEVAVKGADVTLPKLTINNTVTYGKYKYKVTVIYRGALDQCKAEEIIINDAVKIQK
jgi:hypothetical protein